MCDNITTDVINIPYYSEIIWYLFFIASLYFLTYLTRLEIIFTMSKVNVNSVYKRYTNLNVNAVNFVSNSYLFYPARLHNIQRKKKIIEGNSCIAQRSRSLVLELSGTSAIETRVHTPEKSQLLYLAVEKRRTCNWHCHLQSRYGIYKNRDKIKETHMQTREKLLFT